MKHTRRDFLKNSAKVACGLSGLALPFGKKVSSMSSSIPLILLIHCDGGWDQTYVFDSKYTSTPHFDLDPEGRAGKGANGISFVQNSSRPSVTQFFETYSDRACIINGLFCQGISHKEGIHHSTAIFDKNSQTWIDRLSIFSSESKSKKIIPHLVINAPYFPGGRDQGSIYLNDNLISKFSQQSAQLSAQEIELLSAYEKSSSQDFLKQYVEQNNILKILQHYETRSTIQNFFATNTSTQNWIQHGKMALNLYSQGLLQCASIRCGDAKVWDSHTNHQTTQSQNFEMLFAGLLSLIKEMEALKIQNQVTIVIKSELGRRPKLNALGGKDHWPYTSLLLWGAGIRGGFVFGGTDEFGIGLPINPLFGTFSGKDLQTLTFDHIFAALFEVHGANSKSLSEDIVSASAVVQR